MREELTQARDCARFAAQDLRAALAKATPIESLLLYPLIGAAEELQRKIGELLAAVE